MTKVFLDCDVLLDVMIPRKNPTFKLNATTLLDELEGSKIFKGCTSPLALSNIHYLARKEHGTKGSIALIKDLCDLLETTTVDQRCVDEALNEEKIKDFEDMLQLKSANFSGAQYFVTRNLDDYPETGPTMILDPPQMMRILKGTK